MHVTPEVSLLNNNTSTTQVHFVCCPSAKHCTAFAGTTHVHFLVHLPSCTFAGTCWQHTCLVCLLSICQALILLAPHFFTLLSIRQALLLMAPHLFILLSIRQALFLLTPHMFTSLSIRQALLLLATHMFTLLSIHQA